MILGGLENSMKVQLESILENRSRRFQAMEKVVGQSLKSASDSNQKPDRRVKDSERAETE
jgi:hypothetical protein